MFKKAQNRVFCALHKHQQAFSTLKEEEGLEYQHKRSRNGGLREEKQKR